MIDSGRHFIPLDVLYRNIDGMEAVKMNVFHWHLSENQGFRVESKKFPKLQELGSDGFFYTQEEVREVIEYAHDRGIRVVPNLTFPATAPPGWSAIRNLPVAKALTNRTPLGSFRSGIRSHQRKNLQIPQRIFWRDGQTVS